MENMPRKNLIKNVKRIVVKVGTSSLTDEGVISSVKIQRLTDDVLGLVEKGYQVAIVSFGRHQRRSRRNARQRNSLTIPERQALASIGQGHTD